MKIFTKKLRNVFLLISEFLLFCTIVSAQGTNTIIDFAEQQYCNRNYNSALKEYQRALFFGAEQKSADIYNRIANIYLHTGQYKKAAEYFDISYFLYKNDSLKNQAVFNKTDCYITAHQFEFALIELLSLNDSLPECWHQKKNFYLALCYFGLEDYEKARSHFINAIGREYLKEKETINGLFSKKRKLCYPNPQVAYYMSMIIPGTGQLYAGDIKNGLNSMALNGSLLYLGFRVTEKYSLLDAILAVFPWFQRYYQGGYQHARDIAEYKRENRRNAFYKQILTIISQTK